MQEAASAAESLDLDMPVDMGPVEGRVSTRPIMDKLVFSYYAVLVEVAQRELLEVRRRCRGHAAKCTSSPPPQFVSCVCLSRALTVLP